MLVKLTPQFLECGLTCPPGKRRLEYVDKGGIGLYVEVRATSEGQGTYYLRYKDASGKTCHQKIGRTTDIGLDEARDRAKKLKAKITLGADPQAERKAKQSVPKFSEFFTEHYLPYARPRKRTWKKDEELFRLRLKGAFGNQPLNKITRHQIQDFHSSVLAEGLAPASANHYVKLLRRALNLAVAWSMLEKNPAARIELFHEDNQIEQYLDDQQLARLLNVLWTDKNRNVCRIFLFLLATGARLNEALQATWDMISLENRVWRIPSRNSKSKRVRAVPLNDAALEVLNDLDTEGRYEYLFINPRTQAPYSSVHKVWTRLRTQVRLKSLTIHGLRHFFASMLVCSGRSLFEVQKILGHSSPIVTQRYAHLSTKALQDAANSASDIIKGAMRESS